jgi:hypothetical protein
MMTYLDLISARCDGEPITITRCNVESYMSKRYEEGRWVVTAGHLPIANFSLVGMPGCCGMVVSTGSMIIPNYRGRGLGHILSQMRVQMAWNFRYTVMFCTDVLSNTPQQKILRAGGWNRIWTFRNRRTTNDVSLDVITLKDTGVELGFKAY